MQGTGRVGMAAAAALLVLAGAQAVAQENPLQELLRKVAAGEKEDGFCKTVKWTTGSRETYVGWLNGAAVGHGKVNKFKSGSCQYDEVIRIYSRNGRKCVQYRWHACENDGKCGSGTDADCKAADGDWDRVKN